ncbi:MAG TPA: hypothetical protein VHM19_14265 [Polyangiales bacterium]|nr:hypothetical protein [Polyangiales bacterium]
MLRIAAPALAAIALVIVLAGESADLDHDLQLIVPAEASVGQALPVRALVYSGLRAVEGPQLTARGVAIDLAAGVGHELAHAQLGRARGGTNDVEGMLPIPASAPLGAARVRARVRVGRDELVVEAPLQLVANARGTPAEGRALRELQQLAEDRVERMPFAPPPPAALHVRVAGGACIPEQKCTLYVHVGEPAAAMQVEPNAAVTPSEASGKPSAETSAVVALEVVTHGPEAQTWLRATRNGRTVARRRVRLPIALGSESMQLRAASLPAGSVPELSLPGVSPGTGCIVDAFRLVSGTSWSWERTGSLADCSLLSAAPFAPLPGGIHRVQARQDPFSAASAAVRVFSVGEAQSGPLTALAAAAHAVDPGDAFATFATTHAGELDETVHAAAAGYLAAILEQGIVAQPRVATGYANARAQLSETRTKLMWLALAALALGGLALALTVGQRGLRAGERVSQILVEAGEDPEAVRRARLRSLGATIASALALLLVFAVLGLYVLARAHVLH